MGRSRPRRTPQTHDHLAPESSGCQPSLAERGDSELLQPNVAVAHELLREIAATVNLESDASLNGSLLSFTWHTALAHSYQLEYTDDLLHSNWTALGTPILGTGMSLTLTNEVDLSADRFFRLRILP